jgi:DNA-binding NtrC family response regulator
MKQQILIVDDDPIQRRLLRQAISKMGLAPLIAHDGEEAVAILSGPQGRTISLAIVDLVMPEVAGLAVLERRGAAGVAVPVIVQTAPGGIDTVVTAIRAGAVDFVVKPARIERLEVAVRNALNMTALKSEIHRVKKTADGALTFENIVTSGAAMERVIRLGKRAATSTIPILIEGESGVGKELVARAIQGSSERRARPFITVNCESIAEDLVESVLFGLEQGAFAGAVEKPAGKFQQAHGGTLFLDQIGELSLDIQARLLRAIQEGEIDPVGARQPVPVDFRLICATNDNLIDLVKSGRFREDLYYRLNVFPIWIPPLRDRREDIPELARHFIARFAADDYNSSIVDLTVEAATLLSDYHWPGNIRQLEHVVFRAVVLCRTDRLTVDEFPQIVAQLDPHALQPADQTAAGEEPGTGLFNTVIPEIAGQAVIAGHSSNGPPFGFIRCLDTTGHIRTFEDMEREMIQLAIDHYGGRMTEVARRLRIGRSTLYRKLKDYGLDASPRPVAAQ